MTTTTLLYLHDLSVGDRFESGTHALDADQIIDFAGDFDPQPFHLDPVAAQDTFFGGLVPPARTTCCTWWPRFRRSPRHGRNPTAATWPWRASR